MPLPPEIVDLIIDSVDDRQTLRVCSQVAKIWVARSQMHLFRWVTLYSYLQWYNRIPVGDNSPARYTRVLHLEQVNNRWITPENLCRLFHHLKDFKNVEKLILWGWTPWVFSKDTLKRYFSHFGERLRSLELSGDPMKLDSFLVLLGLLPNLEDLHLENHIVEDRTNWVLAVSPKLSGRLTLYIHRPDTLPALHKLPVRFREIYLREHNHDYQGLIDTCAGTLVSFRAVSPIYDRSMPRVSFGACREIREVAIVKRRIRDPTSDLTDIASSITSKHFQRFIIAITIQATDEDIRSAITCGIWEKFDNAVTQLAKRTLDHGKNLQLELHTCGNLSVELLDQLFPLFVKSGHFKVFKTSYISAGFISDLNVG